MPLNKTCRPFLKSWRKIRSSEALIHFSGLEPWPDQTDTSPESPGSRRCQGDWCWEIQESLIKNSDIQTLS